jgi:GNAT superfamily N-acetyltransferase
LEAQHPNFRSATANDMRVLLDLAAALYAEDSIAPFDIARAESGLRQLLTDASLGHVWMIMDQQCVAGYLVLTWGFSIERRGRMALIDELYVAPPHRGRGFGTRALEFAQEYCRAHGGAAVLLEVSRGNARAKHLYSRCGMFAHDRDIMTKYL